MKVCDLILQEIEFGKGRLFLVGGRPAMGKTSFARCVSIEMAQKGHRVGYFSLEIKKDEWNEKASKNRPSIEISSLPIDVLDEVPMTIADIKKSANEQAYDLLIIDYLQLIDREEGSIEEIIKGLRKLADSLELPIVVLSQLSRQIEIRENHMPMVDDLKLSGIDSDMFDQVFLLYRGHYYDREDDPTKMVVVKKNGSEQLEWDYDSLSVL